MLLIFLSLWYFCSISWRVPEQMLFQDVLEPINGVSGTGVCP